MGHHDWLSSLCLLIAAVAHVAGSLDGNAREFVPARRYGSCDAPGEQQSHDGGHLPRTLRVQRPCR